MFNKFIQIIPKFIQIIPSEMYIWHQEFTWKFLSQTIFMLYYSNNSTIGLKR